uniref:Proline rich protein n=1 Tax=Panagrellus redivivus TaxID=6233 RepID=A0A7E4ZQV4_PANRE
MWWPCLFLILSVHARVNDVKDDYYYPADGGEFPVIADQLKPRRVDSDTNMFEITGQYEYKTNFVYGPDQLFEFRFDYTENNKLPVFFELEFDTPHGNSFKFEIVTISGYVVNVEINEERNSYLCNGQGTTKIISFKLDFEKKEVSCSNQAPKPFENTLRPVDFDIDNELKIVPLRVAWNVGKVKMFWKFPAKAIPFRKIDKPKTTTVATTKKPKTTKYTFPTTITEEATEQTTEKQTAKAGFPIWGYIIIVAAVFIAIAAVIAVIITIKKRKAIANLSPDEHYPKLPPDPFASDIHPPNKPTESTDKPPPAKMIDSKQPSLAKPVSAPPSQIPPVSAPAPAPTPAPPSAPEVAKTDTKKLNNEKTAEISLEGRADIKPDQSPGQNVDKLAKKMKKHQSQRTDEIFT